MAQTAGKSAQQLRKLAEEMVQQADGSAHEVLTPEDAEKLLHELQVHQFELGMQNDELRYSEHDRDLLRERYFDLYNLAPVGYMTLNDQGDIVEANLTSAIMLGVIKAELVQQPLARFIFPEDEHRYYLYHQQLAKPGRTAVSELRMVRADGSLLWARLQATSAEEGESTPPGFRLVLSDCTSEKLAEIELRSSKEQWEKTFDAMAEIITIQDKDMHIVRANKAAHQFFQAEAGELKGKLCYEVFGTTALCPACPLLETLQDREEHSAIISYENMGKIFQVSSSAVTADNGEIEHIVHVAKDITELKKMEEELFQTHKLEAIGTLAGGIAHDFNNILGAIMGFSELAKRGLPEGSKAGDDIDQVISSSQRAANLVQQILLFSHKADQRRQPFQPHLIVKEAMKMLRATLPTTISIEEHIDPECGSILADPTSLHQIVVNLCTNASLAMENEKGTLTVTLCRTEIGKKEIGESDVSPGPFVELTIQDTGQGMDKQTLARIFEPYFTTREVGKGSGLGLAVVHGIIKALHGFIRVESEPGKGSTFHLCIPALAEAAPAPAETRQQEIPGGRERILIVDDERTLIELNMRILKRLGYTVTATTSSVEALEKVRSHGDDFDLVITDQGMPTLSGVELAREILKMKPAMPIILCSGYSTVISKEGALAMGIKKYAEKPLDHMTLARVVREALDGQ